MRAPTTPQDLARSSLSMLFMVGLIAASFWILRPFLPALLWATMIVVAAWPLMMQVEALLWGRRALAVTVMTVVLLLIFAVPFSLAVGTLVAHLDEIVDWAQSLKSLTLPAPPGWVESVHSHFVSSPWALRRSNALCVENRCAVFTNASSAFWR